MALLQLITTKTQSLKIRLYNYQKTAFNAVILALMTSGRALMVMATGLGKTIVAAKIVEYFFKSGDTVLVICHDNGILDNTHDKFKSIIGSKATYAKFYGKGKNWNADKHNFVFATFQSLHAHLNDRKNKNIFSRKHFKYIVVDEGHHSGAENFSEVIKYFAPQWILGMTATADREDETDIRDIFGREVVNYSLPEAIAKGWLTPVDYRVMSDGLDAEVLQSICNQMLYEGVRLSENQINKKIFVKARTEEQCKIIDKFSRKGKKAIVFCESIEHLRHVATLLPSSVTLHSKQDGFVNDENFEKFAAGKVRHALVVDKFNEGIDIPDTDLIVFLRATGSRRIFLQQLGRGLRLAKGKKKVTVLDFVANIERIKQVQKLMFDIEGHAGGRKRGSKNGIDSPFHVEGKGFQFDFDDQIVNVLTAFKKVNVPFYPTWQEAAEVAKKMGIKTKEEYLKQYKKDFLLPSDPRAFYLNFPGFSTFLSAHEKYATWQEAAESVRKFGAKSIEDYRKKYIQDPKLYFAPNLFYSDFPGYPIFLAAREKYPTWQEASVAAIKLKIASSTDYRAKYIIDPKLPSNPREYYSNFPGYYVFLSTQRNVYPTWQEAAEAVKKMGIKTRDEYKKKYKADPRLPSTLDYSYPDFPGSIIFFGSKYLNWKEASAAAKKLKIKNSTFYKKMYKKDSRLPAAPDYFYSDFPGWIEFLVK